MNTDGAALRMDEGEKHVSTTEARAGTTPHMARYALAYGTALVVILFAIILLLWT